MFIPTATMQTGAEQFPFHRVPGTLVFWNEVPCLVLNYYSTERSTRNLKVLELDHETPHIKHVQWVGEKKVAPIAAEHLCSEKVSKGIQILRGMPCQVNKTAERGVVQKVEFRNGRWGAVVYISAERSDWLPLPVITIFGIPNPFAF